MQIKTLLKIVLLGCLWGPSFLFIKFAVEVIPPITIVAIRLLISALLLYGLTKASKRSLPTSPLEWLHFTFMGIVGMGLPFFLFCYAEKSIPSALAGIVNGSTPIFTAIFSHFLLSQDRMNWQRVAGIFSGLVGLVLLFLPKLLGNTNSSFVLDQATILGIGACGLASICYAICFIYAKKFLRTTSSLVAPTTQIIACLPFIWGAAYLFEKPFLSFEPTPIALIAVFCLAIFGTVAAFSLYYHILETAGPTNLSMSTYLFPFVSAILGYVFLGEELPFIAYFSGVLILLGMYLVTEGQKKRTVISPTLEAEKG